MFLDYYHLREQPFGVTPDPRYLYLSRSHREALASLYYGVEAGRGFMTLIAEPGMGKTTLLMQLLERLHHSACVAFLFQTQCNSRELLRYLLADMGLATNELDLVNLHTQLNQALIRISHAGRRFVLVIDEAQNLDNSVLETVRLLSDFETPSSKLMQIVLSGQPQLAEKLASPALVQLRQRIAIHSRLEPFSPEETAAYIEHRLQIAGREKGRLFTSNAVGLIADQSEGIPRNINNLCFNTLSMGCALRRSKIDREIVLEAVKDFEVDTIGQSRHTTHADSPPAAAVEPRNVPKSVRQRGIGCELYWSAAWGSVSCLVFLLLFSSLRRDCANVVKRVFARDLPAAKLIQRDHPTIPMPVSAVRHAFEEAPKARSSSLVTSTRNLTPSAEVKLENTFYQICVVFFGRFDRWLSQRMLALSSQPTDHNHIGVGQQTLLPRGTRGSAWDHPVASAMVSRQPQQGTNYEP